MKKQNDRYVEEMRNRIRRDKMAAMFVVTANTISAAAAALSAAIMTKIFADNVVDIVNSDKDIVTKIAGVGVYGTLAIGSIMGGLYATPALMKNGVDALERYEEAVEASISFEKSIDEFGDEE